MPQWHLETVLHHINPCKKESDKESVKCELVENGGILRYLEPVVIASEGIN